MSGAKFVTTIDATPQVKGRRFVDEMSVATVAVRGERCLNSAAWIPARIRTDAAEDRKACGVSQQPN